MVSLARGGHRAIFDTKIFHNYNSRDIAGCPLTYRGPGGQDKAAAEVTT